MLFQRYGDPRDLNVLTHAFPTRLSSVLIGPEAGFEIHMQPFELNPDMPKGGQNTGERLMKKYGFDKPRLQENRKVIAERAAAVRSEEHTSELQSLMRNSYAVFCLKKTDTTRPIRRLAIRPSPRAP